MLRFRLKEIREEVKLTRHELLMKCHQAGMDVRERTLLNWEEGHTQPKIEDAGRIAKILGRSVNDLLVEGDDK